MRPALTAAVLDLPQQLRRSLTWDHGREMAEHLQFTIDPGVQVYFCDPRSPWQRGTNENTNGLLRQYLPKSGDLRQLDQAALDAIAAELNGRPRQTLGFKTHPHRHSRRRCPDPMRPPPFLRHSRPVLSLGRTASSPRGGSLVLPPRPGWRDLAGRCWHARPQPQTLHQPTRHPTRPMAASLTDGRLRWLRCLPLAALRHATVSTGPRFHEDGQTARPGTDGQPDDPDRPSRRWPDAE